MDRDLIVFRSANKGKDTIGLVVIIGDGYMYPYNSRYNHNPFGKYSVQTNSIFYNMQAFLKNPILTGRCYD